MQTAATAPDRCITSVISSDSQKQYEVAVTDVVILDHATCPTYVYMALKLMNIPLVNQWSRAEYAGKLLACGLELKKMRSLEPHVLEKWMPSFITKHVNYVVVVATPVQPEGAPSPNAKARITEQGRMSHVSMDHPDVPDEGVPAKRPNSSG